MLYEDNKALENTDYDGLKLGQTTSFPVRHRVTFLRGLAVEFKQPAGADR
jgi:hypothetical protein